MAINFPASPSIGDQVTSGSIVWKYDGEKWVTIRSLFDRGIISLGTESEPGLAILGDANTGIYSPGADQVAVTTNGTGRLFIDSSGNVGIGISTPSNFNSFANDLVIGNGSGTHGLAIYSGNTSSANIVFVDGTTGTDLNPAYISYNHFQNKLQFYVNYAESSDPRLVINSSGDVGIGTSSPVATLQVNQPTSDQSGAATILAIGSAYGTNKVIHSQMNTSNADKSLLYLENGSGVVMNVNGSGNVGIGTTSPGKLLSIQDSTAPSLALYTGSTIRAELKGTTALTTLLSYSNSPITFNIGGSAETEAVRIDGSGRVLIGTTTEGYAAYADNLTIADSGNCGMTIRSGTSNQGNIYFSDGTSGSDEYEGIIQYLHNDDAMAFGVNNGSERMRIDSSGLLLGTTTAATNANVTVRATSPQLSLYATPANISRITLGDTDDHDIGQIGYDNSDNSMFFATNTYTQMILSSGGVLGIGMAPVTGGFNDTYRLQLYDTNQCFLSIGNSNTGSGPNNGIVLGNDGGSAYLWNRESSNLKFATADTERMCIDSSGNLGIGTAYPAAKLDVRGIIYTGDQIGINTTSPQSKIHAHAASGTPAYFQSTNGSSGSGGSDGIVMGLGSAADAYYWNYENGAQIWATSATERMRLDSSGAVKINTTSGTARLNIYPATGASNPGEWDHCGLGIGNSTVVGEYSQIGLGYFNVGSYAPSYIGLVSTSAQGYGKGDLVFGTRNVTTDSQPTEWMRIAANGDIGLGTSNPIAKVDMNGLAVVRDRLLVGTVSATSQLNRLLQVGDVTHSNTYVEIRTATTGTGGIVFSDGTGTGSQGYEGIIDYVHSLNALRFYAGAAECMRINSLGFTRMAPGGAGYNNAFGDYHEWRTNRSQWTGYITNSHSSPWGVGFIYPNATPNSNSNEFIYCADATAFRMGVRANGGIVNYQSNNINLCDEREKKNIVSLETKWDKVKSWDLKKFHYNEDADTDDLRYGVIAQQVEIECPEVLTEWVKQKQQDAILDDDGNITTPAKEEIIRKGVKEQQMMWMAIKALQEAQLRIETLEAEVAALKAQQHYSLHSLAVSYLDLLIIQANEWQYLPKI